jgi:aerobic carbon-monoxide dehydrogenase medium subunit
MIPSRFAYRRPETLEEAIDLLTEHGDDAGPLAGGTALVLLMRQGLVRPEVVVGLDGISELGGISATDEGVRIGATVTHRQAETSPVVAEASPLLVRTLSHVATIRIRNAGTVGGNLAHADPNQDPPVTLIAHGATVSLTGPGGVRSMPVEEFFVDYYETARQPSELLTAIDVPRLPENTGISFLKFLPRSADDYATVSVAATVRLDERRERCAEARVALGSVAGVPIRAHAVERALAGQAPTEDAIREAASQVRNEVDPIPDARGSAEYKREMAEVFVRRALTEAFAGAE